MSSFQASWVSSPKVSNSENWALSFASAIEPGLRPSPNEMETPYFSLPLEFRQNEYIKNSLCDVPGTILQV